MPWNEYRVSQNLGHGLNLHFSRKAGGPIVIEVCGPFTNESWPLVQRTIAAAIAEAARVTDDADSRQTWD